jgi:RNA polymerase sigma factor (sigma-70 family)
MEDKVDRFLPTRRSLLSRLKSWEQEDSWREFFDTYWRLIYDVAIKSGLGEQEAEDAVQETIISVAKQLKDFQYNPGLGSFKGWLLQITRRRIADQMRKRYRAHEVGKADPQSPEVEEVLASRAENGPSGIEGIWEAEWENHLRSTALERIKRKVKPEQFQMFDFYVLKGWPVGDAARALGVSVTQVYLARHRIGGMLKKELKQLRRSPL